jgi:hypothetical protein
VKPRVWDQEPTGRDLQAIEEEWPVIAAELAVLDAEIANLMTGEESSPLSRRRLRRAQARLTRLIAEGARWSADDSFGGAA